MSNMFADCKTLGNLYKVFMYNADVTFEMLTDAELERLADVFEANVQPVDMVDTPLTEVEFNHIKTFVKDKVESSLEESKKENVEEEKMITVTTEEMRRMMEEAAEQFDNTTEDAEDSVKVKVGETANEFFERTNEAVNVVNGALGTFLNTLDKFVGFSSLKATIVDIYQSADTATGKKSLFKMAQRCREVVDMEIESINGLAEMGLADGKLVEVLKLIKEASIFEKFAISLMYIAKKVTRKLRKWFQVDNEKSVLGSIYRSVAGIASVIGAGCKIVWNAAKFAVSFVVAGVLLIAAPIVRAIMGVVEKIKDWVKNKFNKLTAGIFEEEIEDEEIEDELEELLDEEEVSE